MINQSTKLNLILINPKGFCAGVSRAIEIVNKAIEIYKTPIYIRHEIVHNKTVVNEFKNKGVIFVKEINEIPQNSTAIFSAHGVSKTVEEEALLKNIKVIDATCPLVKKVHKLGLDYYNEGYQIILVGHKGHPEVEGTFGRVPSNIYIVSCKEDVETINVIPNKPIAYITQTTLSLDDTKDIIDALKLRFPNIAGADKNICYATQNRQNAIKSIISKLDALIVIGSKNSSNSNRLKEIGEKYNKPSFLIDNKEEIPFNKLNNIKTLGLSAGASAPDSAIYEIIKELKNKIEIENIQNYEYVKEDTVFYLPKELR